VVPLITKAEARPAESPFAEVFERSIQQILTVFGRLSYLAGLRDTADGVYYHIVFNGVMAQEDVDTMIRVAHQRVFCQWLGLSLAQQRGDLARYLGHDTADDDAVDAVVRELRNSRALLGLTPVDAHKHEKELFEKDLLLVMQYMLYDSRSPCRNQ
jgi:hypothetical protein